jgi:predicted DNA-binding transcriptional regulator AlpA
MPTETDIEVILVCTDEAARLLGMSRRSFERIDSNGKLGPMPVKILKGRLSWSVEELRAWVRAGSPARAQWQIVKKDYGFS